MDEASAASPAERVLPSSRLLPGSTQSQSGSIGHPSRRSGPLRRRQEWQAGRCYMNQSTVRASLINFIDPDRDVVIQTPRNPNHSNPNNEEGAELLLHKLKGPGEASAEGVLAEPRSANCGRSGAGRSLKREQSARLAVGRKPDQHHLLPGHGIASGPPAGRGEADLDLVHTSRLE